MTSTSPRPAIFTDFDGTITRRDVGYHLFKHFSGGCADEPVALWKRGELSTRDCLTQEAALCRITPDKFEAFLEPFELSPGFEDFAALCRRKAIDLTIVSDGLDIYIDRILERHNLAHLKVISNHGRFQENSIRIDFPYDNESCDRCGSCKGERIAEYRRSQDPPVTVVFIGDGLSDVCGAREADLVLAKKDLEEYCRIHDIGCVHYNDFRDVTRCLQERKLLR